jgi:DNA-binding protein HU-beta
MSKAFLAETIRASVECTGVAANRAAGDLIAAITKQLKKEGSFNIPGFGTLVVAKRKARMARNPATGEQIKVKASKTVRFKASKNLKESV